MWVWKIFETSHEHYWNLPINLKKIFVLYLTVFESYLVKIIHSGLKLSKELEILLHKTTQKKKTEKICSTWVL